MKKFIKPLLYSLGILFIFTFFITILNYIGLISGLPLKIIKIIIPIICYALAGFMIGKGSDKKGWLSGIEIGLMLTIVLLILNLIFKTKITIIILAYYLVLTSISVIFSILGINKRSA